MCGRHEADAKEKIERFVVIHGDGFVEGVFRDVEQFTSGEFFYFLIVQIVKQSNGCVVSQKKMGLLWVNGDGNWASIKAKNFVRFLTE